MASIARLTPLAFLLAAHLGVAIEISGTVLGAGGKPPARSRIEVARYGPPSTSTLLHVEAGPDGRFRFGLREAGLFRVVVAGVSHQPRELPLFVESEAASVGLEVRLEPHVWRDDLSKVAALGDFNGNDPETARPLRQQADGTLLLELDWNEPTLSYQLTSLEASGRPVNGTSADEWVYDRGGSFWSVIHTRDGKARIVLDPAKLARGAPGSAVKVSSGPAWSQSLVRIGAETRERLERWAAAAEERMDAGTLDPLGDAADFAADREAIRRELLAEKSPVLRQALLVSYLSIRESGKDPELSRLALAEVPFASWFWLQDARALPAAVKGAGQEARLSELLLRLADEAPDRQRAAGILLEVISDPQRPVDAATYGALRTRLVTQLADTRAGKRARDLPAELAVVAGKAPPAFAVAALGDPKTVHSPESLRGKWVLVDFWATWCLPCVAQLPTLHQVHGALRDKGFEILSVSFDKGPEPVVRFRSDGKKDHAMPWLHAVAEKSFASEIGRAFGITSLPYAVLLDPQGRVAASGASLDGARLEPTLRKLVAGP